MNPQHRIRQISIDTITKCPEENTPKETLFTQNQNAALKDLTQDSLFHPVDDEHGPYNLKLSIEENRLIFRTQNINNDDLPILVLSLKPYSRLIKDYFIIMKSYDNAIKDGKPSRIEAIDMGRRGLHNEGASLLRERLEDKITIDMNTARKLFTLICVLHTGKMHILR